MIAFADSNNNNNNNNNVFGLYTKYVKICENAKEDHSLKNNLFENTKT
jgi:hypothetical protein